MKLYNPFMASRIMTTYAFYILLLTIMLIIGIIATTLGPKGFLVFIVGVLAIALGTTFLYITYKTLHYMFTGRE